MGCVVGSCVLVVGLWCGYFLFLFLFLFFGLEGRDLELELELELPPYSELSYAALHYTTLHYLVSRRWIGLGRSE
jgi:hypothetical protein